MDVPKETLRELTKKYESLMGTVDDQMGKNDDMFVKLMTNTHEEAPKALEAATVNVEPDAKKAAAARLKAENEAEEANKAEKIAKEATRKKAEVDAQAKIKSDTEAEAKRTAEAEAEAKIKSNTEAEAKRTAEAETMAKKNADEIDAEKANADMKALEKKINADMKANAENKAAADIAVTGSQPQVLGSMEWTPKEAAQKPGPVLRESDRHVSELYASIAAGLSNWNGLGNYVQSNERLLRVK
jgi:membrane protein involved in colicin uptake